MRSRSSTLSYESGMKIAQHDSGRNEEPLVISDGASDTTICAIGARSESRSASPEAFVSPDGDVGPFTVAGSADMEARRQLHVPGDGRESPIQIPDSTSETGDDDAGTHGNLSDDAESIVTVRRSSGDNNGISMVSISNKLRYHGNEDALFLRQQSWLEIVRGRILRHGIESSSDDPFTPEEEVDETAPLPLGDEGDNAPQGD